MGRFVPIAFGRVAVLGLSILTAGLATGAAAQEPEDVAAGHYLALRLCTFCHVVSPGQQAAPFLNPPAASFRTIANRENTTAASLSAFLHAPHKTAPTAAEMPDLELSDEQISTLVSFMVSLRGQR
jgi:cytochrome c1